MDQVPIAQAGAYCGADVDATIHLYDLLAPRLQGRDVGALCGDRAAAAAGADRHGDGRRSARHPFLAQMSVDLTQRLAALEQDLFAMVGHEFNLRSTQQLSQVLFDELSFPTTG